jgi:hypothetical protein
VLTLTIGLMSDRTVDLKKRLRRELHVLIFLTAEGVMLDRISEAIWAIVTSIPAWLVPEGSPNFMAIRAMFGLVFIVLIVYLIAMRPFRSAIASVTRKAINLFS